MIKVGSDFSGVGAFNQALIRLGIKYEEVFACDMDKYARQTFILNYGEPKYYPENVYEREIPTESLDIFMTSPPCFVGETLINTSNGFTQIKDISLGDYVLTHQNRYRKVVDFGSKTSDIVVLKAQGILDTKTTANHRYYVREKSRIWDNKKRADIRVFSEPKWVEAKDLTKNHFVSINIPNIEQNTFGINKEVAYILGRYVADGWLRDRTNEQGKTKGNCVIIAIGKDKIEGIGEKIKLKYYLENQVNGVSKLFISSNSLVSLIKEIGLGTGAINKRIPQSIINLPKDILQEFVSGYIDGDGHSQKDFFRATSVSKELLMGLQLCIAKLYNVNANIKFVKTPETTVIQGRTVNQRDYYVLEFRKEMRKQSNAAVIGDKIWYPIRSVDILEEKELVFDITVEEDHSFTANQAIVHNCQSFSLAGKRKGEDSKNGVLFYNSHEFIVKNNPRYFIFENVKGLLSDDSGKTFQKWIDYLGGKSVNGNPVIFPHEESVPYHVYYQVMNAKHYGVPQNRERIFIIGIRDDADNNFSFPKPFPLEKRLKDVLENQVNEKYFLSDKMLNYFDSRASNFNNGNINFKDEESVASTITSSSKSLDISDNIIRLANVNPSGNGMNGNVYGDEGVSPTLSTNKGEGIKIGAIRGRNPQNPLSRVSGLPTEQMLEINENGTSNALTTVQKDNVVIYDLTNDFGEESPREYTEFSPALRSSRSGLATKQLSKQQLEKLENLQVDENVAGCITNAIGRAGSSDEYISSVKRNAMITQRIRRLTPTECFRLMDFNNDFIEKTLNYKKNLYFQFVYSKFDINKKETLCNAKLKIVKDTQTPKNLETYVLCTTKECLKMDALTTLKQKSVQKEGKNDNLLNVNFAIELLEKKELKECATNIIKWTDCTETLYMLMRKGKNQVVKDILEIQKDKSCIEKSLKITLEENLSEEKLFTTLILLKQIMTSKIYTYVKMPLNTQRFISSTVVYEKKSERLSLSCLKMEYTEQVVSDSMLYKQAGNSICVGVLAALIEKLNL